MSKTSPLLRVALILLLQVVLVLWLRPQAGQKLSGAPVISLNEALAGGDRADFEKVLQARAFEFPEDHGPHPQYRVEWWYVTGNLHAADKRQFGYQLTLFRVALAPGKPPADSNWRARQLYMGHFALTDVAADRHYAYQRFSRAAAGLAGARADPFRVWLEDWSLQGGGKDMFPLRVRAGENGHAIDLSLLPGKGYVLQGDDGFSRKSAEAGNASYYYSYPRMPGTGTVRVGGEVFEVRGNSWLDREWSSSSLGAGQSGWDWFALQFDDGRDLMFYRLRRKDGSSDPLSAGTLVNVDGTVSRLQNDDVSLEILDFWTSPVTGDRYPAGWRLQVLPEDMELRIVPKVKDQEMRLAVRYWEGAVTVQGRQNSAGLAGEGYLEMTRYQE